MKDILHFLLARSVFVSLQLGIKLVDADTQIINFTSIRTARKVSPMNTTHSFCRLIGTRPPALAALLAIALIPASRAEDKSRPAPERIGVYDSRAVAIAYAGSAVRVKKMKDLTAQATKARETGNTNEVLRLEAEGRAWQANLHRQGFGTAPVDDLLAHIASDLRAIQQDTGVTRFISKWNKAELDRHPDAKRVDVTMRLVNAFEPNATQRQHAIAIQKQKPRNVR